MAIGPITARFNLLSWPNMPAYYLDRWIRNTKANAEDSNQGRKFKINDANWNAFMRDIPLEKLFLGTSATQPVFNPAHPEFVRTRAQFAQNADAVLAAQAYDEALDAVHTPLCDGSDETLYQRRIEEKAKKFAVKALQGLRINGAKTLGVIGPAPKAGLLLRGEKKKLENAITASDDVINGPVDPAGYLIDPQGSNVSPFTSTLTKALMDIQRAKNASEPVTPRLTYWNGKLATLVGALGNNGLTTVQIVEYALNTCIEVVVT